MRRYGSLNTTKATEQTRHAIEETFRKWGIDEYRIPRDGRGVSGPARLIFYVNDQPQELTCARFYGYRTNLRALYLILEALRLAQERGIMKELARAAIAMLPAGERGRMPHEVLGIAPDAPLEVAEAAYRVLARKRHPDTGGTEQQMKELNAAIEALRATEAAS